MQRVRKTEDSETEMLEAGWRFLNRAEQEMLRPPRQAGRRGKGRGREISLTLVSH